MMVQLMEQVTLLKNSEQQLFGTHTPREMGQPLKVEREQRREKLCSLWMRMVSTHPTTFFVCLRKFTKDSIWLSELAKPVPKLVLVEGLQTGSTIVLPVT